MAVFQGFSFICIYHDLYKMVSKWCQNLPGVSRGAGPIIYCAILPFLGSGIVLFQILFQFNRISKMKALTTGGVVRAFVVVFNVLIDIECFLQFVF